MHDYASFPIYPLNPTKAIRLTLGMRVVARKPFAFCVLASYAGHNGLVFLAEQADNDFEVGIAAHSAC